jgi:hypothetical protein
MALLALEGVYEDGKIELKEHPAGVRKARVVVMFLPEERSAAEEAARSAAAERMIARMRKGINFGGEKFNREELYTEDMPGTPEIEGVRYINPFVEGAAG